MVHVWKDEYWSTADAFLLPLTGLENTSKFGMRTYLFWKEHTIDDYKLMLTYDYPENQEEEFLNYCRSYIFPTLDRKGYLVENYDIGGRSIFVLDMSEWAMDIHMFLGAKYSKLSKEAKTMIERFHTFNRNQIPIHIYAVLYPNMKMRLLDNTTPIDYVCKHYLDDDDTMSGHVRRIGEIGIQFKTEEETLLTDLDSLCHFVRK